jgi:hypothetical protein
MLLTMTYPVIIVANCSVCSAHSVSFIWLSLQISHNALDLYAHWRLMRYMHELNQTPFSYCARYIECVCVAGTSAVIALVDSSE